VIDPALQTLCLPFEYGSLKRPQGDTLFLRARMGLALHGFDPAHLLWEQSFRPLAAELERFCAPRAFDPDARFALVMALPPRQREESRALIARALQHVAPGGTLLLSALNDEGARSVEADLRKLTNGVEVISKNHCRVVWAKPTVIDTALLLNWLELDAPRPILEGRLMSRPGLFAWDRIDAASQLLVDHLPPDLHGDIADLGAGSGFIAKEILARYPSVTRLDLYEAEQRALDLARLNLKDDPRAQFFWTDVSWGLEASYDAIVSNPPFHLGRADSPALGLSFIEVCAQALKTGGKLYLVANRHLPYESAFRSFSAHTIIHQAHGYKVIRALK